MNRLTATFIQTLVSDQEIIARSETVYAMIRSLALLSLLPLLMAQSAAPLDDALFTPPPDYRAALQRPDGIYDLSKPDTLMNRVESYRELAAAWADYLLRNGLRGILPGTQAPARY
jgi:hypothetical protein